MRSELQQTEDLLENGDAFQNDFSEYQAQSQLASVVKDSRDVAENYAKDLQATLEGQGYDIPASRVEDYAQNRFKAEEDVVLWSNNADILNQMEDLADEYADADETRQGEIEKEFNGLKSDLNIDSEEIDMVELDVEKFDKVKDARKEADSQLRQAERTKRRVENEFEADLFIDKEIKGWARVGTYLDFAGSINTISNMLSSDDGLDLYEVGWSSSDKDTVLNNALKSVDNALSSADEAVSSALTGENSCKDKLGSGSSSVKANVGAGTGQLSSAAFVAGLTKEEGLSNGVKVYSYVINAMVQNAEDNDKNLTFSVILRSDNGGHQVHVPLKTDADGQRLLALEVAPGESEDWVLGTMLHYPIEDDTTTRHYDEVCLEFQVNNINDFFDVTTNTKQFCRRLEKG